MTFKVHKNITQWQSTYGYLGSYLGWDPSAYQYGMLTYENVSVDSKESSAGIFPISSLTQNLNTKSNNLYLLFSILNANNFAMWNKVKFTLLIKRITVC